MDKEKRNLSSEPCLLSVMIRMHTSPTSLQTLHRSLPLVRQISPLNPPNTSPLNHPTNIIIILELRFNTILEINLISDIYNLTTNHRQKRLLSSDMLLRDFKVIGL